MGSGPARKHPPARDRVLQGRGWGSGLLFWIWSFVSPFPKPRTLNSNPKALRTHILRFLGPKTILYMAFGLFWGST